MYLIFQIQIPKLIANFILWLFLRYKKIFFGCDLKVIPLSKGRFVLVDSADYEILNKNKWGVRISNCTSYAIRFEKGKYIYMHNQIMQPPAGYFVDHKDHNGLNNSRGNLRLATKSQNCCNQKKKSGFSSKYRGVYYDKRPKKWAASIKFPGKRLFLGYFDNEIDAARVYDAAARKHHGEFAVLNFP